MFREMFEQHHRHRQQQYQYRYQQGGDGVLTTIYHTLLLIADIFGVNRMFFLTAVFFGVFSLIFFILDAVFPDGDRKKDKKADNVANANKSSKSFNFFTSIPHVLLSAYMCIFAYRYYYHNLYNPDRATWMKIYEVCASIGSPLVGCFALFLLLYLILDAIFPEESEESRRQRQKEAKKGAREASISRHEQPSSSTSEWKDLPIYDEHMYNAPTSRRLSVIAVGKKTEQKLLSIISYFRNDPIAFYRYKNAVLSTQNGEKLYRVFVVKKGGRWQEFVGDELQLEDWLQRLLGGEVSFVDREQREFPLLLDNYAASIPSSPPRTDKNATAFARTDVDAEDEEDYEFVDRHR